jgi:hypothetical protein
MDRYSYGDSIGKLVGKTSSGSLILENEETGEVTTHSKKDVKKVLPYTVKVAYLNDLSRFHIVEVKEGSVKEGDLVVLSSMGLSNPQRVFEVNTKKIPTLKDCQVYRISSEQCHP